MTKTKVKKFMNVVPNLEPTNWHMYPTRALFLMLVIVGKLST